MATVGWAENTKMTWTQYLPSGRIQPIGEEKNKCTRTKDVNKVYTG